MINSKYSSSHIIFLIKNPNSCFPQYKIQTPHGIQGPVPSDPIQFPILVALLLVLPSLLSFLLFLYMTRNAPAQCLCLTGSCFLFPPTQILTRFPPTQILSTLYYRIYVHLLSSSEAISVPYLYPSRYLTHTSSSTNVCSMNK